ncbi:ROK family protein [Solirubrobacter soli]|uniref:ROK family protein n=1 Tax=Solirubrobacter soli TaxID=363832 RepID=UPI0003F82AA8|nr:ROK family protein [Solirubrobacter soli]
MPAKPTLDLLRSLSDEHVLRALMEQRRATRAELAAATGLSKPTVSESVRRLSESGAVIDTGERTTGRGRVGTYYALPEVGRALVCGIAPEGIVAEAVDVYGDVVARAHAEVPGADTVARALEQVAGDVADGPFRLAVVSAADPVDRETGRLIELPDAPFLVGALDPPAVLATLVDGPVTVDNDVNWAARGERAAGDFVYLYLGEGLGCAVVSDGEVRRGHAGLAGEIAHVVTTGPNGEAMRLTDVFRSLDLRRAGSTAIDVPRLLGTLDTTRDALARALGGVLNAIVALTDPAVIVVGGRWGEAILPTLEATPRTVSLQAAQVDDPLTAARAAALTQLRDAVVTMA